MSATGARYLPQYANQTAWLQDNRREANGALLHGLVRNAIGCPLNRVEGFSTWFAAVMAPIYAEMGVQAEVIQRMRKRR